VLNAFGGHIANTAHVWGLLLGWLTGQVFVARKNLRIPLIAATIIAWVLPIALIQRPVWERTLGHVPRLNRDTWLNPPQDYRDHFERNAEHYPPGFL